MKKMLIGVMLSLSVIVVIIFSFIKYFSFVNTTIYDESISHLKEIYHQTNNLLQEQIKKQWSNLKLWSEFLDNVNDEESVRSYFNQSKDEVGFNNFYFVSHNSESYGIDDKETYFDLSDSDLYDLVISKQNIVVISAIPNHPQLIVFAVPTQEKTYKGFTYEAIAISFNSTDFINSLTINSFNGKSNSFLIHSDGRIIMDTIPEQDNKIRNFFSIMNNSSLSESEKEMVKTDFKDNINGSKQLEYKNVKYYIIYESIDVSDWMIIGMVPTNIVNKNMSKLQSSTIGLIAFVSVILFVLIISLIISTTQIILKKKDSEIINRDELFSYLSFNVNDIFMMINAKDFTIDYISPNVNKLLGISIDDLKNNIFELDSLSYGDNAISLKEQLLSIGANDEVEWYGEYVHQITRETHWYRNIAQYTTIQKNGKYILVMSDRTEEILKNQEFEKMAYEAESANRAKSKFLSNMSHDIRTPMNAILGFTNLALSNAEDKERSQEYLKKILASSNHLLSLINDVLDMSKIESGRMKLTNVDANLSDLFHNIESLFLGEAKTRNLEFQINVENVENEDVYCDKTRFNQLIFNLVSNAIKYTPAGGKVAIYLSEIDKTDNGYGVYQIIVKDSGIGMSKDFLKHIFEPFERELSSTVNKIQGTGLGMSIAKNIVEMMSGTIDIKSELGKGTEITLTIPLKLQDSQVSDVQIAQFKDLKALVVDEDFTACDRINKMFAKLGIRSEWTISRNEVITKIKQSSNANDKFNIYIIGEKLSDINGLELVKQIKDIENGNPIIILNTYNQGDIETEIQKFGTNVGCSKIMFLSDLRKLIVDMMLISEPKKEEKAVNDKHKNNYVGKKILVVEDNALNTEIACEILSSSGFIVNTVVNGEEAVKYVQNAKKEDINLILMDVQMPIMDGYTATKMIRAIENKDLANIPIIAMTANAFDEDRNLAFESGMNGFISKPIDINEVFSVIEEILEKEKAKEDKTI